MPWQLLIIQFIASILLLTHDDSPQKKPPQNLGHSLHHELTQNFHKKKNADLLIAFTLGNKTKLSRQIKKKYQSLTLSHLFTPSGLHLSALYLIFIPLLRKCNRILSIVIEASFCLLLFLPSALYSIKRIAIMRLFHRITLGKLPIMFTFYLVFFADYLFGSFELSPLSHIYSFLFLGTILASKKSIQLPLSLASSQFLLAYLTGTSLSLIAPFIGFFISSIFAPFFIIFLLSITISTITPFSILEYPTSCFDWIVSNASNFAEIFPEMMPSLLTPLGITILMFPIPKSFKISLLLLSIIFYTPILHNLPHKKPIPSEYRTPWFWIDRSNIVEVRRTKRGYQVEFGSGYRCSMSHYNWFYKENCY